jgi:hypothetical protein
MWRGEQKVKEGDARIVLTINQFWAGSLDLENADINSTSRLRVTAACETTVPAPFLSEPYQNTFFTNHDFTTYRLCHDLFFKPLFLL